MSIIYVTAGQPGTGRTGVAAAIGRGLAYAGQPVQLVRLAEPDTHAADDAAWFASLDFAPGSPSEPLGQLPVPAPGTAIVAEGPASACPAEAIVVAVERPGRASLAGLQPAAVVRTWVAGLQGVRSTKQEPLLVELGEDRTLAGFALDEALALIHGEVLLAGDLPADTTSDYLVIAPIGSDAGQPYFRRFPSMTVVARFDRTDMHLAALRADPNALILTGGRKPSGYTLDAAEASGVPVVLSRTDTENTVIALEAVFERTRFRGERKLERMAELLASTPLMERLGARVGAPA